MSAQAGPVERRRRRPPVRARAAGRPSWPSWPETLDGVLEPALGGAAARAAALGRALARAADAPRPAPGRARLARRPPARRGVDGDRRTRPSRRGRGRDGRDPRDPHDDGPGGADDGARPVRPVLEVVGRASCELRRATRPDLDLVSRRRRPDLVAGVDAPVLARLLGPLLDNAAPVRRAPGDRHGPRRPDPGGWSSPSPTTGPGMPAGRCGAGVRAWPSRARRRRYPWGEEELVAKVGGKGFAFIGSAALVSVKCGRDAAEAAELARPLSRGRHHDAATSAGTAGTPSTGPARSRTTRSRELIDASYEAAISALPEEPSPAGARPGLRPGRALVSRRWHRPARAASGRAW